MKRIRIEPAFQVLPAPSQVVLDFETRMAKQRQEFARQDRERFRNPNFDPIADQQWHVYRWHAPTRTWRFVCWRPKKSRRRKPMTMNRLFAIIRSSKRIPKHIPIRLISKQDDNARIARNESFPPPQRFGGRHAQATA